MVFKHNSSGIDPNPSFPTLPEGQVFEFRIVEAEELTSKRSGLPMIKLQAEVINDEEWNGTLLFHYVTFIPKGKPGDGMSVHFRKSIGVPYGGDDVVDAEEWKGKRFKATTKVEEYEGKKNSKISAVESRQDEPEDIPF